MKRIILIILAVICITGCDKMIVSAVDAATPDSELSFMANGESYKVTGSNTNTLRIIDTAENAFIKDIKFGANGFATSIRQILDTQYAIVSDIKRSEYSVIDMANNSLVNTYSLNVPVMDIIVADRFEGL